MGKEQRPQSFARRFGDNFANLTVRSGIASTTLLATQEFPYAIGLFTNTLVIPPAVAIINYDLRRTSHSDEQSNSQNAEHDQIESFFIGVNVPLFNYILTSQLDMTSKAVGMIGLVALESVVLSI